MKCPKCKEEMEVGVVDISHSSEEKKYDRTIYKCKVDDIYVTVEVPR